MNVLCSVYSSAILGTTVHKSLTDIDPNGSWQLKAQGLAASL